MSIIIIIVAQCTLSQQVWVPHYNYRLSLLMFQKQKRAYSFAQVEVANFAERYSANTVLSFAIERTSTTTQVSSTVLPVSVCPENRQYKKKFSYHRLRETARCTMSVETLSASCCTLYEKSHLTRLTTCNR